MNIRIEKHHIYNSLPTVYGDDKLLFYCLYQEWADDLVKKLNEMVDKYQIQTLQELENHQEYIRLQESYQQKKDEYGSLLDEDGFIDSSPFGPEVDGPFIEFSPPWGGGVMPSLLLTPKLCVFKSLTPVGKHNKQESIYDIRLIKLGNRLLHVPDLEIARMVCDYINDFADWESTITLAKFETWEFLKSIKNAILEGSPFPPISQSKSDTKKTVDLAKINFDDIDAELNQLVGLSELKDQVNRFIKKIKGEQKLLSLGLIPPSTPTMHMVFSGPEGTGKTAVANIIAKLLSRSGYLKHEKVIEVTRGDLVGYPISHTMEKTKAKIDDALGGILFIKNAYTLRNKNTEDETEQEILNYIVKRMDEEQGNFIVILEGQQAQLDELLDANPGLQSRISHWFHFRDFTPSELAEIAKRRLEVKGYETSLIQDSLEKSISTMSHDGIVKGNARWVETFSEKIIENLLVRIADSDQEEALNQIKEIDLKAALGLVYETSEQSRLDSLQDQAQNELLSMVGLTEVKDRVFDLMKFLNIENKKREKGYFVERPNIHMVFYGSPGTGKTTIARIIAKFLRSIGWLSNGHLIEVSRSDLVAKYLGQTAPKVRDAVNRAKGGVLFIDEAYSLAQDDFGQEAINELIKEMENKRDEVVIILAGYKDLMDKLLDTNPGFRSRVPYRFHFPDYSIEEIVEMTMNLLKKNHLLLSGEKEKLISQYFQKRASSNRTVEGNGRFVRNLVENIRIQQNKRIYETNSKDYESVEAVDIEKAFESVVYSDTDKRKIGFGSS
ncbi:AAA family ATPase [Risungbinella massiliensis]|uniref:AAA family ATPase n=1 Tax=Risungbinella massiliensis TaxID=1329796 RepID=UPI00069A836E|nr:AAA family ATPase [Risungbinella massiliensis]